MSVDKETLEHFLQPFTGEITIKVRRYHHDRGEIVEDIANVAYGFENNEGVVYLELTPV